MPTCFKNIKSGRQMIYKKADHLFREFPIDLASGTGLNSGFDMLEIESYVNSIPSGKEFYFTVAILLNYLTGIRID